MIYTGNPRATTVAQASRDRGFATLGVPMNSRVVLVVGGSRGAKAINQAMVDMAPMLEQLDDVHVVYVTGDTYFDETREAIRSSLGTMPNHLHVLPYVHNMPEVLACTSLIVNRAGASFLAEITSLGIPSILIPSPNVTNNHQEANARTLEGGGASLTMLEKDLTGKVLYEAIAKIMNDESGRKQMAEASRKLGKPDAAEVLVHEIQRLAARR